MVRSVQPSGLEDRESVAPMMESERICVTDWLRHILTRWRVALLVALTITAAGVVMLGRVPRLFRATTSFIPSDARVIAEVNNFSGRGSVLGIGEGTPEYYSARVQSTVVLKPLLESTFSDSIEGHVYARPLRIWLRGFLTPPVCDRKTEVDCLRQFVGADIDKWTGITTLAVDLPSPRMASYAANRLRAILDSVEVDEKRRQFEQDREFMSQRVDSLAREGDSADREVVSLIERNRVVATSSVVAFELRRAERQAALREETEQNARRLLENVRTAELTVLPPMTVIDTAQPPGKPVTVPIFESLPFVLAGSGLLALIIVSLFDEMRRWRAV